MKAGVLKASTGVIPALSSNELFAENASLVKKVRETRNATATPPMAVPEKKGNKTRLRYIHLLRSDPLT